MAKLDPILSVFQHRDFSASIDRRVVKTHQFDRSALTGGSLHFRQMFFSQLQSSYREYSGTLQGEYILLPNGRILLDRGGMPIAATGRQYANAASRIDEHCSSVDFIRGTEQTLDQWDRLPVVSRVAILSDLYTSNYYHWSLELTPRIRMIDKTKAHYLAITPDSLQKNFQRSLLALAKGDSEVAILTEPVRVRDPFFVDGLMSEDGILWLRHQTNLRARKGARRIYISRGQAGSRATKGGSAKGGDIAETPDLQQILKAHRFETIEFSPDMRVEEQVRLLDGADIVLSAHGAALTNICYLERGTSLIEIVGERTPRGMYMEIAGYLGLRYAGYAAQHLDENEDLIVDPVWLQGLLGAWLAGE
jgi:capsular polysaccharide biosynthesis protein